MLCRDFNDCKWDNVPPKSLSPDRDDFVYERRQTSRHEEIREIIDEINVSGDQSGLESMRYPLLERRIQKAFSTSPAYTVPLSSSAFLRHTLPLSCFLYEVRGVRVARKINNYEARGDDSNGEIKVSQSKVILRILRYSHFVFVFGVASKLFA